MRVLITGGAGFVAGQLVASPADRGRGHEPLSLLRRLRCCRL